MAATEKTCPGCETVMEAVLAKDVELDCCPKCGGLWFDHGELSKVAGRKVTLELLGGHTSRRCAFCHITLEPALLPGAVPVETCTACRGIYLDEDELEEFAGSYISLTPRDGHPWKRPSAPPTQSFVCVKCGGSFPLRNGNALRAGLACLNCTPQPQTTAGEKRAAQSERGGFASELGGGDLGGGFDLDFDFDFSPD